MYCITNTSSAAEGSGLVLETSEPSAQAGNIYVNYDKLYLHSTIMALGKLPVGRWKVIMYFMMCQILYSGKFSYGANFRIFCMGVLYAKIKTMKTLLWLNGTWNSGQTCNTAMCVCVICGCYTSHFKLSTRWTCMHASSTNEWLCLCLWQNFKNHSNCGS